MAVILDVEHVPSGERRAMKLMLPLQRSAEAARRMEREFLTLSRLFHPAVLKVFDCGVHESGRPWFVTERIQGQDLRVVVEDWRSLPPPERFARAESVLVQVAQALAYIHDQGLVHRDVTPGNIMLLPDGTVRLMDFGVVKEPGADLTQQGEVVGTVAYIAPEQITGGPVDARADLYALGAVLYLMVTGRRPFNARNLAGYLDKHLHRPPRPPRELAPTLPARLDTICLRLLQKEPDERFASARHLLLALDDRVLPGEMAFDGDLGALPVTGRSLELSILREGVTRLIEPPGGTVTALSGGATDDERRPARSLGGLILIQGSEGSGKSRLSREAQQMARQVDVAVTRVRGTGDQRPWSGLRAVAEAVDAQPGVVLPENVREALLGGRRLERWAVTKAARELIVAAGPRLLVIDDANELDTATLDLVAYLVRNLVGAEGFPLLVLLTADPPQDDDPIERMFTQDLGGVEPTRLRMHPFPLASVEELLLHYVIDGPRTRALAARLWSDSEGNPFFLGQMLRDLVSEGIITPGEGELRGGLSLELVDIPRAALPVPQSLREALEARLRPVSPDGRAVLDLMAIAREPLGASIIAEATGLHADRGLDEALQELQAALLITAGEAGAGRHILARHRLADVLIDAMSQGRRRDLHARLARALERQNRRQPERVVAALAEHFAAADHASVAWPYLLDAARQLHERGEVAAALDLVERGLELEVRARASTTLDEADRRLAEALRMRTSALVHLGRWEEARVEARRGLQLAQELGDDLAITRAATELGALHRRRHDLDAAETWLALALRHAPALGAETLRGPRIVALYELGAVNWARGDLDASRMQWVEALAAAEALHDERYQALGSNGLGVLALCRGEAADARRHLERAVELCLAHGMAERLVIARINLIELHHMTGNLRRGSELADRTVAEAREVGNPYGVALGLRYRALILADLGQLLDARENAMEAARMQAALGNPEEELSAQVMAARAALYRADPAEAERIIAACEPLLAEHDTEGYRPVVLAWRARILFARGDQEGALKALHQAEESHGRRWPHQRIRVALNLARAWEVLGQRERAAQLADEALRLAEASGYRLYAMRARQIAARTTSDDAARARHLRVAEALSRSIAANLPRGEGERFMTELPLLPGYTGPDARPATPPPR